MRHSFGDLGADKSINGENQFSARRRAGDVQNLCLISNRERKSMPSRHRIARTNQKTRLQTDVSSGELILPLLAGIYSGQANQIGRTYVHVNFCTRVHTFPIVGTEVCRFRLDLVIDPLAHTTQRGSCGIRRTNAKHEQMSPREWGNMLSTCNASAACFFAPASVAFIYVT